VLAGPKRRARRNHQHANSAPRRAAVPAIGNQQPFANLKKLVSRGRKQFVRPVFWKRDNGAAESVAQPLRLDNSFIEELDEGAFAPGAINQRMSVSGQPG
jgi:hypothetical protein